MKPREMPSAYPAISTRSGLFGKTGIGVLAGLAIPASSAPAVVAKADLPQTQV
jgi:hypothetical protein